MFITAILLGLLSISIIFAVIFITKKSAVGVPPVFLDTYNSIFFLFVFTLLLSLGISIAKFVGKFEFGDVGVYVSTVVLQILFSGAVLLLARKIGVAIRFENFGNSLKNAFGYFLCSISVLACGGCISLLYKFITGEDIEKQQAVALFMDIDVLWLKIFAGFSIIVLAPIAEELFFRGLLYPCVKGWIARYLGVSSVPQASDNLKNKVALVSSAILVSIFFSIIHSSIFALLPIFLMGLILICVYEKTNSIIAPIVTHLLFNLTNVLIIIFATK